LFKKILIAIIAIVVIGGIASASGDDEKASTPTSSKSAPAPKPVVEAIKVTAADLAAVYESNEVKADQTYKGKMVEVTGTVDNIGVSIGQTYVVLSNGKEYSIVGVQCFFKSESEIAKVAELKKGDSVTIQGKVDGKSINVGVNNCILK